MTKNVFFIVIISLLTFFSCDDEVISVAFSKSNLRQLLTGSNQYTWALTDDGQSNFDPCVDEKWLVISDLDSDTGLVYYLQPRVLCDPSDTLNASDTLAQYRWVIPDTVGSAFEDSLLFFNDNTTINLIFTKLEPEEITIKYLIETPLTHDYKLLIE